jgi:hypothetical protein
MTYFEIHFNNAHSYPSIDIPMKSVPNENGSSRIKIATSRLMRKSVRCQMLVRCAI